VRDLVRRTPRGAVIWRAANGSKPDARYLTPAEAEAAPEELLAAATREPNGPRRRRAQDRTFGEACEAWLAYVHHVPQTDAAARLTALLGDRKPRLGRLVLRLGSRVPPAFGPAPSASATPVGDGRTP
jgi:hypothetical protein